MRAFAKITVVLVTVGASAAAIAGETQAYTYDALGRLIAVQYSGTINNGQAHSLCYDPAGNRTKYKSDPAGVLASCTGGGTPANQPPVANPDSITLQKCAMGSKDVVANDSDPDGNLPLALQSVDQDWAFVESSTNVGIIAPDTNGTYVANYVVADTLGATATSTLTLTVSGTQLCP